MPLDMSRTSTADVGSTPPAWAATRQELCETLPYFRAYHAGCHARLAHSASSRLQRLTTGMTKWSEHTVDSVEREGVPYGYLLGGFGAPRDVWAHQGRVIISHGGGKSAPLHGLLSNSDDLDDTAHSALDDVEDDSTYLQADMTCNDSVVDSQSVSQARQLVGDQRREDAKVACLLHSMQHTAPIVLLASRSYGPGSVDLLAKMPASCQFVVLGWYWITDAWCEREGGLKVANGKSRAADTDRVAEGCIRYKFRFEYINSQGHPWWLDVERRKEALPLTNTKEPCATMKMKKIRAQQPSPRILERPAGLCAISLAKRADSTASHVGWCRVCEQVSAMVFQHTFVCLRPECTDFWTAAAVKEDRTRVTRTASSYPQLASDPVNASTLVISDSFLQPRREPVLFRFGGLPFSLSAQDHKSTRPISHTVVGNHCGACGRMSCREEARFWRCAHCGQTEMASIHDDGAVESAEIVSQPPIAAPGSLAVAFEAVLNEQAGIQTTIGRILDGQVVVTSFVFPSSLGGGIVHVLEADTGSSGEQFASQFDELFRQLQVCDDVCLGTSEDPSVSQSGDRRRQHGAVRFRRHALANHHTKGALLSQQFTSNYGVAYKHAVQMDSVPMNESPPVIRKVLALLRRCTESTMLARKTCGFRAFDGKCLQDERKTTQDKKKARNVTSVPTAPSAAWEFNEIYPVLYLEAQKMNYHDDGEPGLGPLVSSLSLGEEAIMSFRLKAKYTADHKHKSAASNQKACRSEEEDCVEVQRQHGSARRWAEVDLFAPGQATDSDLSNEMMIGKGKRKAEKQTSRQSFTKECALPSEGSKCDILMRDRRLLHFPVRHGSMVIQEGHGLQSMLEHSVEPLIGRSATGTAANAYGRRTAFSGSANARAGCCAPTIGQKGGSSTCSVRIALTARKIDSQANGGRGGR